MKDQTIIDRCWICRFIKFRSFIPFFFNIIRITTPPTSNYYPIVWHNILIISNHTIIHHLAVHSSYTAQTKQAKMFEHDLSKMKIKLKVQQHRMLFRIEKYLIFSKVANAV